MATKIISIEIGNSLIRICQMDYKKKNPKVYRHVTVPTPDDSITDGYLNNIDALKTAIKEALQKNKMKSSKQVIFTIASSKIVSREVMLPPVKQNMIASLVRTNLSEYFPIDLSAYEVAHMVLEKVADGPDAGKYKVQIMAAEKELIKSYEKLADACGLKLLQLDYAGNSIYQAFKNEDKSGRVMVLKIEENQTTVTVVKNKNLILQRSINYGLQEVIQEVVENRAFGVNSYQEACILIRRRTCIKSTLDGSKQPIEYDADYDEVALEITDYDESTEIAEAKMAVTKSLSPLVNGVARVIDFYNSRNAGESIDRVFITGMGGDMTGLDILFSNEVNIQTDVLKKLEGVGWHALGDDADIYSYVACIGATFDPIGFANKDKKDKGAKETNYTFTTILMILFTVAACGALGMVAISDYNSALDEEQKLHILESRYVEAEQTYLAYANLLALYEAVYTGDRMTERPNNNLLVFFEELENMLPADVEVISFASDDEQASITMRVATKEIAAGVLNNLRSFESLMNVSITSLAEETEEVAIENPDTGANEDEYYDDYSEGVATDEVQVEVISYVEFTVVCTYYPAGYVPDAATADTAAAQ